MQDPGPRPKPERPLTGGCSCGAIRYTISAFPLLLYACHCTQCQRQSGSAFALNMPVATTALRVTAGTPQDWTRRTTAGDAMVRSFFCGTCGNRIYASRDTRPASVNVRAGTLDDTSWLMPVAHFFMGDAQRWETIADPSSCYDSFPPDYQPLAERWRALWGT